MNCLIAITCEDVSPGTKLEAGPKSPASAESKGNRVSGVESYL